MKSIRNLSDIKGKVVLIRGDLNVPLDGEMITDPERIDRFIPSVKFLVEKGAKVIIASHLGRPDGKIDPEFSLAPVRDYLSKFFTISLRPLMGNTTTLKDGDVAIIENLRFAPGEEANDPNFARELARGVDIYVNDAFSVSHRAHASVEAITRILPSYAGFLMEEELENLAKVMDQPTRPLTAIVGGAKISTKLGVLNNLCDKVDFLIIGGAMANTFLLSQGVSVGKSLVEENLAEIARDIMAKHGNKIILPCDAVVAQEIGRPETAKTVDVKDIPTDAMILDVGPKTVAKISEILEKSRTILLNGPMGVFEQTPFDRGTVDVFHKVAELTDAISVAGGGDTVSAIKHAGIYDKLTYVSTAGGAFLEYIEGRKLPGVEALERCEKCDSI